MLGNKIFVFNFSVQYLGIKININLLKIKNKFLIGIEK